MSTTTPSHIETIREALDRELESCQDRLHHAVAASFRDDLRSRIDKLRAARAALEAISRQPAQLVMRDLLDAAEDFATLPMKYGQEDPLSWDEKRTRLLTLSRSMKLPSVAPRQPAQAHDIDKIMEVVIQAIEDNDNVEWKSPPASYNTERDKLIRSRLIKHMNS